MTRTLYIGIDPGASGGWCELWPENPVCYPWKSAEDTAWHFRSLVERCEMEDVEIMATVEKVGGYIGGAGNTGSAMFKFGHNTGMWEGVLLALLIRHDLITPQRWQKGIPGVAGCKEKSQRKNAIKSHAARLYPQMKPTLKTADAICLAEYARREGL